MATESERFREGLQVAEAVSRRVARRLGKLIEFEEIHSIAKLALCDLVRTYDPNRAAFTRFVASRLKWAIFDEVRRQTHGRSAVARLHAVMASERFGEAFELDLDTGDEPPAIEQWQDRLSEMLQGHAAALALGLSKSDVSVMSLPGAETNPEEQAARAELVEQIRHAVKELPDRDRALVERHYYDNEPFEAIAKEIGISKSWASRLHERAIRRIGKALREAK